MGTNKNMHKQVSGLRKFNLFTFVRVRIERRHCEERKKSVTLTFEILILVKIQITLFQKTPACAIGGKKKSRCYQQMRNRKFFTFVKIIIKIQIFGLRIK